MLGLGLGIIEACVWLLDSGVPAVVGPIPTGEKLVAVYVVTLAL